MWNNIWSYDTELTKSVDIESIQPVSFKSMHTCTHLGDEMVRLIRLDITLRLAVITRPQQLVGGGLDALSHVAEDRGQSGVSGVPLGLGVC